MDFKFLFIPLGSLTIDVGIKKKACASGDALDWYTKVEKITVSEYRIREKLIKVKNKVISE